MGSVGEEQIQMQMKYFQEKRENQEKKLKNVRLDMIPSADMSRHTSPAKNVEDHKSPSKVRE